jgi:cell division protein FtsL
MSKILQAVADTISQKPEIGIFGSMAGVALSPIAIISLISAVLGLFVTVITLTIKIMDMVDKIKSKKPHRPDEEEEVFIDNKRYRRIVDEDDAE